MVVLFREGKPEYSIGGEVCICFSQSNSICLKIISKAIHKLILCCLSISHFNEFLLFFYKVMGRFNEK